jgi:hypothetical protein
MKSRHFTPMSAVWVKLIKARRDPIVCARDEAPIPIIGSTDDTIGSGWRDPFRGARPQHR